MAAPASLTRPIQEAATNHATRILGVDARDTSAVHHGYGGQLDDNARRRHRRVRCPNCGEQVDQDHETARRLAGDVRDPQSDTDQSAFG